MPKVVFVVLLCTTIPMQHLSLKSLFYHVFFHLPLCIKLILHTGFTSSQRTLQLTTFFGVTNVLNHHSTLLCSCGHVFNNHSIDKKTCFSLHLLPPCTWTLYNITTVQTHYPNTNLKVNKKQFTINIGDKPKWIPLMLVAQNKNSQKEQGGNRNQTKLRSTCF